MDSSTSAVTQVLIDFVSGNETGTYEEQERAFNVSMARLNEVGAFEIKEGEGDAVGVDLTPLLVASSGAIYYLIERLAEARGVDRDTIFFDLREFASRLAGGTPGE